MVGQSVYGEWYVRLCVYSTLGMDGRDMHIHGKIDNACPPSNPPKTRPFLPHPPTPLAVSWTRQGVPSAHFCCSKKMLSTVMSFPCRCSGSASGSGGGAGTAEEAARSRKGLVAMVVVDGPAAAVTGASSADR